MACEYSRSLRESLYFAWEWNIQVERIAACARTISSPAENLPSCVDGASVIFSGCNVLCAADPDHANRSATCFTATVAELPRVVCPETVDRTAVPECAGEVTTRCDGCSECKQTDHGIS